MWLETGDDCIAFRLQASCLASLWKSISVRVVLSGRSEGAATMLGVIAESLSLRLITLLLFLSHGNIMMVLPR